MIPTPVQEYWIAHRIANQRALQVCDSFKLPTFKDFFFRFWPSYGKKIKQWESDLAYANALNRFCTELAQEASKCLKSEQH